MGWTESPPFFTSVTESIADVANQRLASHQWYPKHHLADDAEFAPTDEESLEPSQLIHKATVPHPLACPPYKLLQAALSELEVYVDDFIMLYQGSPLARNKARDVLLHTIDDILRPLSTSDGPMRQEPISVKKITARRCTLDNAQGHPWVDYRHGQNDLRASSVSTCPSA
jgi:hypothetical protein